MWRPGADFEPELAHPVRDRLSAAHSSDRPVEGGEEAIAGGVDLASPEAAELPAHERVVAFDQFPPTHITDSGQRRRGTDDVGEQDRGENRVGLLDAKGAHEALELWRELLRK